VATVCASRAGAGQRSLMGTLAGPFIDDATLSGSFLAGSIVVGQLPPLADIYGDQHIEGLTVGVSAMPKTSTKIAKKLPPTTMTRKSASKEGKGGDTPAQLIDARIAALSDWRGETLARVRSLIREADPEMVEEVKWRKPSNSMLGVPVWSHAGIICTGETYKNVVKLTFAKGASLKDPSALFNASLEGNVRRAIDIHEGDKIDEKALKTLIRAAVALNISKQAAARPVRSRKRPKSA
jgi:hypothetical protein